MGRRVPSRPRVPRLVARLTDEDALGEVFLPIFGKLADEVRADPSRHRRHHPTKNIKATRTALSLVSHNPPR